MVVICSASVIVGFTGGSTELLRVLCLRTCRNVFCLCGGCAGASIRKASTTVEDRDLDDLPDDRCWLVAAELPELEGPDEERAPRVVWLFEDLGELFSFKVMYRTALAASLASTG